MAMNLIKKINDFIDEKFEHPTKWKVLIVLLIVGIIFSLIPSKTNEASGTSTKPKTTDKVDYSEINQYIDDMKIIVGENDDKDAALMWLTENKATYNDNFHRSKRYLYLDLVSKTRGNFTKAAAQYACENCDYSFKDNALYWANQFASLGYKDDDIKRELGQMQRLGGGFIDSEIKNAVKEKTSSAASGDQMYQIPATVEDTASEGTNTDVDACKEVLNIWLSKDGFSENDLTYYLTTYCDFTSDTVKQAITDSNIDFGAQAYKLINRFNQSDMTNSQLVSVLNNLNKFPIGESKWAANRIKR